MDKIKIAKEAIKLIKSNTSTLGEAYQVARHVDSIILKKIINEGEATKINQSDSDPLI